MTVKTSYAPGEPIWIDLGSPDLDASRRFYGELFGWTAQEGNADFGGYTNFERDGHLVAGLMPLMAPGQPPAWQCYVCTADAAKTSELVESAGGTVIQGSMEVGELGTMAVYTDSVGAFFGVWQPAQHLGAELVDDEGTLTWIELSAKDLDGAKGFYDAVFGWGANVSDDYTEFQQGGQLGRRADGAPAGRARGHALLLDAVLRRRRPGRAGREGRVPGRHRPGPRAGVPRRHLRRRAGPARGDLRAAGAEELSPL